MNVLIFCEKIHGHSWPSPAGIHNTMCMDCESIPTIDKSTPTDFHIQLTFPSNVMSSFWNPTQSQAWRITT